MPIIRSLSTAAEASGLPIVIECVKMHGPTNPKVINVKQAGDIYSYLTIGEPEADAAVGRLLMMGIRMPETC